ncbi:hypothetical protein [Clostridium folliculivorans]|uniref:Phosphoribosylglycinamide formyltransferase 2 n=1 Tax=Clostridium folliculivorans TaxID=2886038 RepID=A0A9W5Y525_9CLOT|nr:hypothetical protein [Clostridium folliculivorans]GKU26633.1 phosphoribosylglycinamide formyltransferase 2 [Clostridium folliculivorans]GKU28935.1 phosphoribosylglycinamide formyltransferase 2 [Clostridium folliculivorans]
MSKRIYYGEFNAEKYWREENLAKLPEIPDKQSENIVKAMDELLFILCDKEDAVLTRYKLDDDQLEYLKELGLEFKYNSTSLTEDKSKEEKNKNICELLITNDNSEIKELLSEETHLETFAVLPEAYKLSNLYHKHFDYPTIDVIKKVNSKMYSSKLNLELDINNKIKLIYSSKELYEEGMKYLSKGSIIIKDSFGVSGKGNLIISNESILKRIVSYVDMQEKKGKRVEFILEPLLEKSKDFSCQFKIHKDGSFEIISVQEVRNTGLSYLGSYTPDKEFMEFIKKQSYFEIMEKTAKRLYEDGYYGDVCIDSMILKDRSICPVVEINARKSMSLIKHELDNYAHNLGLKCGFTFLNVSFNNNIDYSEILKVLSKNNILFKPSFNKGIMPLSSNTIFINRQLDTNKTLNNYKGRFYFAILYKDMDIVEELTNSLISSLKEIGINSSN